MSIRVLHFARQKYSGPLTERFATGLDHDDNGQPLRFVDLWAFGWRLLFAVR